MSKQAKAKENQGYESKPHPHICATCVHFTSEIEKHQSVFGDYTKERNRRCGLGGFAVKKTATCRMWEGQMWSEKAFPESVSVS